MNRGCGTRVIRKLYKLIYVTTFGLWKNCICNYVCVNVCRLMNFGNSCYMNSSLQCLFNAESFCSQLVSQIGDLIYHPAAELLGCFISLYRMRESEDSEWKAFLLMQLMEAAAKTNPDFNMFTQNDAHEFLFHILNQMEQTGERLGSIGGVAYNCPIRANFRFQLKSIITCTG
ncbi:ubiquitin carboxyl-terminal hydrolase 37-like isoform X1 [Astyanax mexicanus]|uniref:Ubiquitin carboxyl-terminal hydrolase 37-like isoform X1 n=1 Tax=Astyanax mexicanus TaxID=7994 RepID=A0A8T2L100_ASTMX|nr:ubiquitin carboxyl-terminal hydrolase 37-like isoform X1 [Astyanax mexicanus]